MRIELLLGTRARAWHIDLADRLSEIPGVEVCITTPKGGVGREERRLGRLLALERLLNRAPLGGLAPVDTPQEYLGTHVHPEDLVINLGSDSVSAKRLWSVRFEDEPGELAAARALRSGHFPLVSVVDEAGGTVATGRPGSEQPGLLTAALPDVMSGVATLLVGSVENRTFSTPTPTASFPSAPRSVGATAIRKVVGAFLYAGYRALYRTPHWRVGWRVAEDEGTVVLGRHPKSGWRDLPDDGYRFYADPFPFEHDGRYYLFVEDYDHRVGKAVISVVEFDPISGPKGTPRPVLTHDVHLSYPFVLEHDGEVWMIPESSGAKTVELYRAQRFPDVWERHSILLEGIEASDATPFEHGGRWWLAATVRHGGSCSDTLHLWHAPDLRGPWTAHTANPVLVDVAAARPAGRVVLSEGRALRPVQDCRAGYGVALAVAEIIRLDETSFEQRVVAHLEAGSDQWPGRRLHTLNRAGALEVVDGSGMSLRLAGRLRGGRGRTRRAAS